MLYKLGRALQLIGLLLLPIAMAGNMADERLTLGQMLMVSVQVQSSMALFDLKSPVPFSDSL